ncbi:MAG: RNA methyltransferase [Candidatus Yonathbacteria bacterium]|nr:RNA methyltransferase [Candidatus Yonathbacteria bacterium]
MAAPKGKELSVILHNIRSVHNVGAIFRTADAVGVSHIYLTGYTPTPLDRFGNPRKDIAKTALGAEKHIPWSAEKRIGKVIARLQKEGVGVVAVEQDRRSLSYREVPVGEKTCVVMGNEVRGLSKAVRDACDMIAEIPMKGKKESLNVSVAAGIALYAIRESLDS